jgi:hypothetical protein
MIKGAKVNKNGEKAITQTALFLPPPLNPQTNKNLSLNNLESSFFILNICKNNNHEL